MMLYTNALAFISLAYSVSADDGNKRYLRAKNPTKPNRPETPVPETPAVVPLKAQDAFKINPSTGFIGSGIELSSDAFTSGDPITVQFKVTPSYLADTTLVIDTTQTSYWSVGIFMRMANPQNGALEPIVSLKPTFKFNKVNRNAPLNIEGSVTFSDEVIYLMEGADPNWPISMFNYGTGFDVWLLNENGAGVLGPEQFTLLPSAEVTEIEESEEASMHIPLLDNIVDMKHEFVTATVEEVALSPDQTGFVLTTDKPVYAAGEDIAVSFEIGEIVVPANFMDEQSIRFDSVAITVDKMNYGQDQGFASDQVSKNQGFVPEQGGNNQGLFDNIFESMGPEDPQYFIGVWMKMARPQGGSLEPIVSIALDSNKGTVMIDSSELNTLEYGTGFDLWIVDATGSEIFGPTFFSIPDPEEES